MTPEQFELLQKAAGLLLAIVGAVGLVPFVNWLKTKLNISGRWAQVTAAIVATIVAVMSLIVAGQLTPESVTEANFVATLLLVWTASQEIYKRLTAEKEEEEGGHTTIVVPSGQLTEAMVQRVVQNELKKAVQ